MSRPSTRREFMHRSLAAGTAAAALPTGLSAQSRSRTPGASDTIRLGIIGCGGRGSWLTVNWVHPLAEKHKVRIEAVCDIWKQRREQMVATVNDRFGNTPRLYHDYRELLDQDDIDAVIIATPDHQHCGMLIDAVRAGKDVYIEKPIAMNLEELNKAADVVRDSKCIVQHGTQGRSSPGANAARKFIQEDGLGKILRIEESRSFYRPYWNHYAFPQSAEDTDWQAFLYNLPDRPYDKDMCVAWMGYRLFSTGPVGGWMSHFSDLNHYITGCKAPISAVAQGGVYSPTSVPPRDCPDTVTAILEYGEGFTTLFTTHFGNGANDYITWFGTRGIMNTAAPDAHPEGIAAKVSPEGSDHPDKIAEARALDNSGDMKGHMDNWFDCIRSRKQPNADMEAGYSHGIAVLLADMAYATGRKMTFDPKTRQIKPV